MMVRLRRSTIDVLFILALIVTYAVNIPLFAGIRPVDIVLLLYIVWGLFTHRVRLAGCFLLTILFGTVVLASSLYGSLFVGIINPEHFAFLYKYSIPFFCVWLIISSALDEGQITFLLKALGYSLAAVVAYEYYSLWDIAVHHPELVLGFRPNFPFTPPFEDGGYLGDAHLLAAYLSTGLVALTLLGRLPTVAMRGIVYYPALGLVCVAMVLTGSRNGIVTFVFVFSLVAFWSIAKRFLNGESLTRMSKSSVRVGGGVLAVGLAILVVYIVYLDQANSLQKVLNRAFSFDFSHDQSALGRIRKLGIAADLILNGPIVIGIGMQSSRLMFFDSGIGAILVTSGMAGIVLYGSILVLFFRNLLRTARRNGRGQEYSAVFCVFANYVLVNLVSEFFLVSRSIIPVSVFLGVMTKWIYTSKCANCDHMVT